MHQSKKKRNNIIGLAAAVLALMLLLAACGDGGGGGRGSDDVNVNDRIIAEYAYVPTFINMPDVQDHIHGAQTHGDRIYYFYQEWPEQDDSMFFDEDFDWDTWQPPTPAIVIASVGADGGDPQRTVIQMDAGRPEIAGFRIADAGHFGLLLVNQDWPNPPTLAYAEFDRQGNEISHQPLNGIVPANADWFHVSQVLFADNGYIVLFASADRGSIVHILDSAFSPVGQMEMDFGRGMVQAADGRVLVFDWEMDGNRPIDLLREIDFAAGDWGDSHPISVTNIRAGFPANSGDPFDLLIDDGSHLFGYDIASGERTPLLNWIESELVADWGYHLGFLPDGRLFVLSSRWNMDGMETELMTLTRTARAELPAREIVTLGGFGLWGDIRAQVVEFNRTSQTHQIQVRDYMIYSTRDDWRAGLNRFLTELATGQGPDIIWGDQMTLAPLMDRGILLDLYAFMDADPDISRSDFFPNVLRAFEAGDGSLPMAANNFNIQTMVGTAEAVGHIQSWTTADMLALLEATDIENMPYILGEWMTGEGFLTMILAFSDFIDWREGRANLDNEDFINLLEIAARLPAPDWDTSDRYIVHGGMYVSELARMLQGDQLLTMAFFSGTWRYQELSAVFEDMVMLGVPTHDGGAHVIRPGSGMGINSASAHSDTAWSFIRQTLLPDARIEWSIPLRIDKFEEMMAEEMTQQTWTDIDGSEVPMSHGSAWLGDGQSIEFYAMTEEQVRGFRAIVESASLLGRFDETIHEIVQEELLPFLAGDRSARDTARILQNRIQTFLSEQR